MEQVVLFVVRGSGFNKTVTARMRRGALEVSSYAFGDDGYDYEFDLRVSRRDVPAVLAALGLNRLQRLLLLRTLKSRFSTPSAESEIARFLKDAGIAYTGNSYGRFP